MNLTRISLVVLLAVAVLYLGARVFAASDPVPQVGQTAPSFTLPSQEGTNVSLDQYRGKWVVLYFYPKDMTSGCTIEAKNFQKDMGKFDAANAVVLGVSVDTVKSHQEFCTKDGLHFKLLADPDKKVIGEYGSVMTQNPNFAARNTFLIDPTGVIRKVYLAVNPNEHSAAVLADLGTLQH